MMLRKKIYDILERPEEAGAGRWVDYALIALIAANVLAAILETVPSIAAGRRELFWNFEVVSVAIFTMEYGLRVWSSVEAPERRSLPAWRARLDYALSWSALIDFMAFFPFYLHVFFQIDLRMLRILRLLRLFKLSRFSAPFTMLSEVIRREASTLFVCFAILGALLVVTATGAYLVERDAQPEDFGSIPAAMWWAMATLTTVGYGDVTPVTAAGRLFGGLVTAIGIGMAALPAGILASGLSSELARRREELTHLYVREMEAGPLSARQLQTLDRARREMGLGRDDGGDAQERAHLILASDRVCPHCGGQLPRLTR